LRPPVPGRGVVRHGLPRAGPHVAQASFSAALRTLLGTAAFFAFTGFVVRPILLRWLGGRAKVLTQGTAAVLLVGVLASAWATEMIGIHALFGAFLFGALIPHDAPAARQMEHRFRWSAALDGGAAAREDGLSFGRCVRSSHRRRE
jgi:hypothetical protein